jgi:ElaB/YqjD/DUF883 family membrane-anchored ribosome-binding protein
MTGLLATVRSGLEFDFRTTVYHGKKAVEAIVNDALQTYSDFMNVANKVDTFIKTKVQQAKDMGVAISTAVKKEITHLKESVTSMFGRLKEKLTNAKNAVESFIKKSAAVAATAVVGTVLIAGMTAKAVAGKVADAYTAADKKLNEVVTAAVLHGENHIKTAGESLRALQEAAIAGKNAATRTATAGLENAKAEHTARAVEINTPSM